jgi:hypothetical protein
MMLMIFMNKEFNKIRIGKRGFSFSFDAIVAAMILFGAIAFVSSNTLNGYEFASQKIVQKQFADDLLCSAIDLNKLQSFDSGVITGFIGENMPTNYDYQLQMNTYLPTDFSSVTSSQTFGNVLVDLNSTNYVETKNIFLTFYNNDINRVTSAKLRVWVK